MINLVKENSVEHQIYSDEWYIYQYLLHGSVEKVFHAYRWDLKISVASYHRLVKKYGIVKASGRREASLTELLHFFVQKTLEPTSGIETLYYQMPPSFQTSLATLHRTYQNILNSNHVRNATGLLIHPYNLENQILVGQEVSTKKRYGKYRGDFSIPMTFSTDGEFSAVSILRVLQQEVLSGVAVKGRLGLEDELARGLILTSSAVFNFHILDVNVSLQRIDLPENFDLDLLSSAKLENLQFVDFTKLQNIGEFRTGILEMLVQYQDYKNGNLSVEEDIVSEINKALLQIPA